MTIDQPERRRSRRVVTPDVPMLSPVPGLVRDLNRSGMQLETQNALSVRQDYYFTIGRPDRCARIRARVLWCRLQATRTASRGDVYPIYRVGTAFLGD